MKIITLERKTIDKNPVELGYDETHEDYQRWWCVIETEEEEMVYDEYLEDMDTYDKIWNAMIQHAGLGVGVRWGDDDIYAYLRPGEDVPEVGETFIDSDNDEWVRVE